MTQALLPISAADREKFYDAQIAPELSRLGRLCQEYGLPFLAVVEYDTSPAGESGFGRTLSLPQDSSESFRWFDAFVRTNANFDRFCLAFVSDVIKNKTPHSSVYLEMMGVHPDPEKRPR